MLDTLPAEYDSRVKAMEVDEKPTESYNDIGGLDKQIEELVEAIVMPMQQSERFKTLGIKAPKGCLMYGPPGESASGVVHAQICLNTRMLMISLPSSGTGKTLLARACAAQTDACYLKLAAPSLVQVRADSSIHAHPWIASDLTPRCSQMFIGDGAKLVRDAFELAKTHKAAIIFIDELDAIGTKRFDSDKSGDREVQRTMLELLNQLDGFGSDDRIKVR